MNIGTFEIRSTRDLINADTRLCVLLMGQSKQGKTTLSASLNEVTLRHRQKPTLFIASEVAEGGGTMSLHQQDIAYWMPRDWQDMEGMLAQLTTDEQFGGVVLDNASDYVERIVKPYVLKFPCKEENSRFAGTRKGGVLQRTDYIPQSEFCRQHLAKLIALTNENTVARYRKDLIVTVLEKEKRTPDGETVIGIRPALPGQLADSVTAMFQSVLGIEKTAKVMGTGATARRVEMRALRSGGDGLRPMLGDRMGLFPLESNLTSEQGEPIGLLPLYEQWRTKMQSSSKAA